MTVDLSQELEQMLQDKVESGRYPSASEVVRDALRLLADRDELMGLGRAELKEKISQGLDSLKRGDLVDGDPFFAELEAEEIELEGKLRKA